MKDIDFKRLQECTKLMVNLVDEKGLRPEYGCFIQKPNIMYTYNDRVMTIVPMESDVSYAVKAKALQKFLSSKTSAECTITVNDLDATFVSSGKKLTVATMPVVSEALVLDVYKELKDIKMVEVPEALQSGFIKNMKQTYVSHSTSYGMSGIFMNAMGFASTDSVQYSLYKITLPIDTLIHLPADVVDYLFKIKEPICNIGFNKNTRMLYLFGESGVIYICRTSDLSDPTKDLVGRHNKNLEVINSFSVNPFFRITAEALDAFEQSSIANDAFNSRITIKLQDSAGEVSSKTSNAEFKASFSWDEANKWSYTIDLDYTKFVPFLEVGSIVRPISAGDNGSVKYMSIENGSHTVFIPSLA